MNPMQHENTLRNKGNKIKKGWLKNNNPAGDPNKALRCGAKTRRGTSCKAPAMPNGRCRMHGGKSTGPRTPEGLERSRRANWKHGHYSKESNEIYREHRRLIKAYEATLKNILDD
jgi:hypothetical protein